MSGQGKVLDVQLVQLVKEKGEGGKKKGGKEEKEEHGEGRGNMVFNTLSRFFPPPPPIFFTSGRVRTLTRLI